MYTSYGKANDRFGFEAKGTFKCAYKHDSIITVICAAVLTAWVVLIIINVVMFFSYLFSGKAEMYSTENIVALDQQASSLHGDIVSAADSIASGGSDAWRSSNPNASDAANAPNMMKAFAPGFMGMSINSITTAFGIIVLILLLAGFIIIMIVFHAGQTYEFKATEDRFIITYPLKMGKTDLIKYEDVLGVKWTVRKLPLLPKCFDIDIKARSGEYTFRVILTKLARVNGITETPFNIIRERAGLAGNDNFYGV